MTKFRSKFESNVASTFRKKGLHFEYETKKYPFVQPAKRRVYTPDFIFDSGVIVECKGKLTADERNKLIWIKEAYPDLPLIVLFMRAKNKIRKGSPTSYGDWATKNKIEWYDWEAGGIPANRLKGTTS